MNLRLRNLFSICLVTLSSCLCLLPGILLLGAEDKPKSTIENRALAGLPAWPRGLDSLQEWPEAFGAFVADQFGGRKALVRSYNYLHIKAGVSPIPRVRVGKQGWLFLEQTFLGDSNRGALPLDESRLALLIESFEKRQKYLTSMGKRFIVLPAPDKNSIYPEFLPGSLKRVGPSRLSQFLTAAADAHFNWVDAFAVLQEAKESGEDVYFQTDSHWNCRGAWFAYQALMKSLRQAGYTGGTRLMESDIEFIQPDPRRSTDLVHNLLNLNGLVAEQNSFRCRIKKPQEIIATNPEDGETFDYIYAAPPGKDTRRYQHKVPRDHSRVLIYRDSYANAMLPFLMLTFDDLIYARPPVQMGFDPEDVKKYDPDLLIYEFVERALFYRPDNSELDELEGEY